MGARGVAMQHLSEKELNGGDRREHTVAPGGIAGLLARANNRVWWQLGRPLSCASLKHGDEKGYHISTPACVVITDPFVQERLW